MVFYGLCLVYLDLLLNLSSRVFMLLDVCFRDAFKFLSTPKVISSFPFRQEYNNEIHVDKDI